MNKLIHSYAPDALMLAGMAAISHGAAQIYAPAGWIVAGGFALACGVLAARLREG
jgi:hypothetical protein